MLTYTDCLVTLRASNKGKTVDVKLGKKAKIYNTAAQKTSTRCCLSRCCLFICISTQLDIYPYYFTIQTLQQSNIYSRCLQQRCSSACIFEQHLRLSFLNLYNRYRNNYDGFNWLFLLAIYKGFLSMKREYKAYMHAGIVDGILFIEFSKTHLNYPTRSSSGHSRSCRN